MAACLIDNIKTRNKTELKRFSFNSAHTLRKFSFSYFSLFLIIVIKKNICNFSKKKHSDNQSERVK